MREKINVSREKAKKEIDDLIKLRDETEKKIEELNFSDRLIGYPTLATVVFVGKIKEKFPNAWAVFIFINCFIILCLIFGDY